MIKKLIIMDYRDSNNSLHVDNKAGVLAKEVDKLIKDGYQVMIQKHPTEEGTIYVLYDKHNFRQR